MKIAEYNIIYFDYFFKAAAYWNKRERVKDIIHIVKQLKKQFSYINW